MTLPEPAVFTPTSISLLLEDSPQAIVDRIRSLGQLLGEAYSNNTQRVWRANWAVWRSFCRRRGVPSLPTDLATIEAFLRTQIAAGRKRATLEQYLYTLHLVHRLADLPNPMKSVEGDLLWRALCRKNLRKHQAQRKPLGVREIEQITAGMDAADPIDLRDRALIWVAYETLMRRSELQAMDVEDIDFNTCADEPSTIWLERSKTDQEGEWQYRPISPQTVVYLRAWLDWAGIESGAVWRTLPPAWKGTAPCTQRIAAGDVARIFKRRARRAGIAPALIAGHSTRIGAAQDLVAAGEPDAAVMQAGGWTSPRMVARYSQKIRAQDNAMMRQRARRMGTVPSADVPEREP